MRMLLLSRHVGAVPAFLGTPGSGSRADTRIAYVDDAAQPLGHAPFVDRERAQLQELGYTLVPVTIGDCSANEFSSTLDGVDAVYVAGGFADYLSAALRRDSADTVLIDRVRAGMPYLGTSAGAMIMGTSIEPAIALDGPTKGVVLSDFDGLGLVDAVIVPHADGLLPPYPAEKIAEVAERFAGTRGLTLLRDDMAVLVDGRGARLVPSPAAE